jgi:ABC-type nickel/cobalt efflux system permease component RcnA
MESEAIQSYLKIAAGGILILLGVYSIIHFILHKTRHSHHNVPEKKEIKSLWIIISVGMIPCPISSLILIFSLTLGLYWYGILFVFAFAAGMAITLLGISLAVHMLREKVFNLKLKKVEWILYNAVPIMAALFFLFAGFSLISPLLV